WYDLFHRRTAVRAGPLPDPVGPSGVLGAARHRRPRAGHRVVRLPTVLVGGAPQHRQRGEQRPDGDDRDRGRGDLHDPGRPRRAIPDDVPLPPLWILGSSLYGGQAAAAFGTGFAFAGHFGSADPAEAVAGYRTRFQPSDRLDEPRVILGVAAIASESEERAEA